MRLWSQAVFVAMLVAGCGAPRAAVERSSPVVDAPASLPPPPPPLLRLVFGSCHSVFRPQPLWGYIAALRPDAFVWLGDIVYADTEDMVRMRELYAQLAAFEPYASVARSTRIVGTWDDHDFGRDNAGKEYPKRVESQQALLDFLGEPADSPRRAQEGVYTSADFGSNPYRVRLILLDTRYHRDAFDSDGDVLGEAQWTWLRAQLERSTAAVHVLGSSIQVIAEEHPYEKWSNFPKARARLLALLQELRPSNLVVISGDRHMAELSMLEGVGDAPPLYDLTSSSMARPLPERRWVDEPNRHRVGDKIWDVNYGVVEVDFGGGGAGAPPTMTLQVRDSRDAVVIERKLPLELKTEAGAGG